LLRIFFFFFYTQVCVCVCVIYIFHIHVKICVWAGNLKDRDSEKGGWRNTWYQEGGSAMGRSFLFSCFEWNETNIFSCWIHISVGNVVLREERSQTPAQIQIIKIHVTLGRGGRNWNRHTLARVDIKLGFLNNNYLLSTHTHTHTHSPQSLSKWSFLRQFWGTTPFMV
jgi:hypothetical protein